MQNHNHLIYIALLLRSIFLSFGIQIMREFGIREIRYANYCVAPVCEITISSPLQSCLKDMVSYPELANQPFRRSHFHSI